MEKEEQNFCERGENGQETGKECGNNALTPGSVTCTCDKNMDQGTKAGATTDEKDATYANPHTHSHQTESEVDDFSTDRCLLFLLQQHQDFLHLMIQQHEQLQHIEEQLCWVFQNADCQNNKNDGRDEKTRSNKKAKCI